MEIINKNENKIISGKAKNVYINDKDTVIIEYTDKITALNNKRKNIIDHKGEINCEISTIIFKLLTENKIPNHFIKQLNKTNILCKKLNMIPLEVILRNYAKGSIVAKYGIKEYLKFSYPVVEFSLKNDKLNDPLISERQIIAFNILKQEELDYIIDITLKINNVLSDIFKYKNITLLDFKIEFGKDKNNNIFLADEISPDSMRLENLKTKIKYDKDIYRHKLGNVIEGYKKLLEVLRNE